MITSIWRGGGYEGLASSLANRLLHVYYLFSPFMFCFFLVFGTSAIDHFLVVVVFVQAKLCSRRVIEVIIIPVLLLVLTADSTLTRLGCMAAADAAHALTGEMLMEYADLSEKT